MGCMSTIDDNILRRSRDTALRNHMRRVFLGDVVLDTFNNVSSDEDNILDQICIKQICPDFYYDDF